LAENIFSLLSEIYNPKKLRWLIVSITTIMIIYLTSEEIWKINDNFITQQEKINHIFVYSIVFTFLTIILLTYNIHSISKNIFQAVFVSIITLIVDITILGFSEYFMLSTIKVLPKDITSVLMVILIGAFPINLGVITLDVITSKYLKREAEKLFEEVKNLSISVSNLEKEWEIKLEDYKKFEEKFKKLIESEDENE